MAKKKEDNTQLRAALRTKKCNAKIRVGSKQVPCGKEYLGSGPCPNRGMHLLKMPTGFCSNGWHEGSKSKDWRGNPVPTCEFYLTCPCDCHDKLGKLFEMTDQERILVDSSGYVPPKRTYWMPSDDPLPPLSKGNDPERPTLVESPAPDIVPPTIRRNFAPTPTGRAARGELELWVKQQCDIWLIDKPGDLCTPSYLAAEIARDQGIAPPSVGAISSVFERWVKLGFAVVAKKPTRFVGYTDEGRELGLEKMKADAKREKKLAYADDRRNLRR